MGHLNKVLDKLKYFENTKGIYIFGTMYYIRCLYFDISNITKNGNTKLW